MANKKISELPTGSTPGGTEIMEAVQSGVNVKLTLQQIADLAAGGGAVDSVNGQTGVVVLDAGDISNTPAGGISATTAQAAINELDTEKLDARITYRRETTGYSLDATDLASINGGKSLVIELNSASSITLTIVANATQAFPVGTIITITQYGTGTASVAAAGGVTIRSSSGLLTAPGQYSPMVIEKVGTNEWYLFNGSVSQISWGTYTPTLFSVTNVAANTAYVCNYLRVGNSVTVSGKVDIDPTSTGVTQLGISLPIASLLTAAEQCAGVAAASGIAGMSAAILGDATNDRAELQYIAVDVTNKAMYFTFTYTLL